MTFKSKEDHDKERAHEIEKAVMDCVAKEKPVPIEWVNEYLDLTELKTGGAALPLSRDSIQKVSSHLSYNLNLLFNKSDSRFYDMHPVTELESAICSLLKDSLKPYSAYK